jgi:hypothetical protein
MKCFMPRSKGAAAEATPSRPDEEKSHEVENMSLVAFSFCAQLLIDPKT